MRNLSAQAIAQLLFRSIVMCGSDLEKRRLMWEAVVSKAEERFVLKLIEIVDYRSKNFAPALCNRIDDITSWYVVGDKNLDKMNEFVAKHDDYAAIT